MKSILVAFLAVAVLYAGCGKRTDEKSGGAKTVIQYDAIPNSEYWDRGLKESYFKKTGAKGAAGHERFERVHGGLGKPKRTIPQADTVSTTRARLVIKPQAKGCTRPYAGERPSGWGKNRR